jgi:hypothetical protein
MTSRSETTDEERHVILQQNDALRRRGDGKNGRLFQRLRRCCICLQNSCADQAACRAEFTEWAERKWDAAVDKHLGEPTDGLGSRKLAVYDGEVIVWDYRT